MTVAAAPTAPSVASVTGLDPLLQSKREGDEAQTWSAAQKQSEQSFGVSTAQTQCGKAETESKNDLDAKICSLDAASIH